MVFSFGFRQSSTTRLTDDFDSATNKLYSWFACQLGTESTKLLTFFQTIEIKGGNINGTKFGISFLNTYDETEQH